MWLKCETMEMKLLGKDTVWKQQRSKLAYIGSHDRKQQMSGKSHNSLNSSSQSLSDITYDDVIMLQKEQEQGKINHCIITKCTIKANV